MEKVMATIRAIRGFLRKKARAQGAKGPADTGVVTLIQRFGGSVNLNIHFHMLVLEGVCPIQEEVPQFINLPPPTDEEVKNLVQTLSIRILKFLTRKGYFEKKGEGLEEGADLFSEEEPVLSTCMAASVQYRIALGNRAGQKVRRLGTMEECFYEEARLEGSRCATLGGFSLHANTACGPQEREKLEKLCRYVARPAVAMERLFQRPDGLLVYKLKKPYNDGMAYLLFSPEELLEKLAALVPIPRVHLTRFHGCLAPHSKIREKIIAKPIPENTKEEPFPHKQRSSRSRLTWAQLLKRVFKIEVAACFRCGGKTKVIAAILDRATIEGILGHLRLPTAPPAILPARAPPQEEFTS